MLSYISKLKIQLLYLIKGTDTMTLGLIGMTLIILAWIISYKSIPPITLSLLYGLGSFFLTIHAFIINDLIFTFLNGLATIISIINIIRALGKRS